MRRRSFGLGHWSLVTGHWSLVSLWLCVFASFNHLTTQPSNHLTTQPPNHPTTQPPYVVVESVTPDSPAAKAGVKVGDRLLTYDGKPLPSPAALLAAQQNTFGKKEVALQLQRGDETLTLTVPLGALGIMVRPELPPDVLKLYEEGKVAFFQARKFDEAISKLTAAAKAAQETKDRAAVAYLYSRGGEVYESQRKWKEARQAHAAAWELLKSLTPKPSPTGRGEPVDAAAQSRTLSALGRCSANLNDFPTALGWFEQARQVDEAAGNEMWAADDLNNSGIISAYRGNLSAAHDYFTRALNIRERLTPDSLDAAASLNNLGNVARERGDLNAAHDYHTRALKIKERLAPDSLDVAMSLNNLGNVAYQRGELSAAHDYFTRALNIRERLAPDSLDAAASLGSLGNVASDQGDLSAAHNYHTRALRIQERLAPDSLAVAHSLTNLGNVAVQRDDLSAAHDYHTRALNIRERLAPDSLDVTASLTGLGDVARQRGDLSAAHDYFTYALNIQERLAPDSLAVAASLTNLGIVAGQRGDLNVAHDCLTRALKIFERLAPDSLAVAANLGNLGIVAKQRGDLNAAHDYWIRALNIRERLAPDSLNVASSLNNLGGVAYQYQRGDLSAAHDYYIRALTIQERLAPDSLDFADSLHNLGLVAYKRGNLSAARDYSIRAITLVESHRRQIASTEQRALLVEQHAGKYTGLLKTYLALNDLPAAFTTLERAHARSMVELLNKRQLAFHADAPADLLKQQDTLDSQRAAVQRQLAKLDPHKDDDKRGQLLSQLATYTAQQQELTKKIRNAAPKFADLQYPQPLDFKAAAAALDAGTLLLAYAVDEKETYLFVVKGKTEEGRRQSNDHTTRNTQHERRNTQYGFAPISYQDQSERLARAGGDVPFSRRPSGRVSPSGAQTLRPAGAPGTGGGGQSAARADMSRRTAAHAAVCGTGGSKGK